MKYIMLLGIILLSLPVLMQGQNKRTMRRLEKQVAEARMKDSLSRIKPAEQDKPKNTIGDSLPAFRIVRASQQMISRDDLPKGKPVLLVLFNPMCDHCQKAAMTIQEHKDQFAHVSVIFITGMNLLGELDNFVKESRLSLSDRFIVAAGNEEFTAPLFEARGIPQIMAYNKEWKLQSVFFEHLDITKTLEALGH